MNTLPRLFLLAFWLLGFLASDGLAQPFPQVIWERNGAGPSSRYGAAIYALGDQNSDGYADFAVYAWGSGAPGQPSQELCEFFHGGNPPAAQPYRQFLANPDSGDRVVVYTVGDVNGDHFIDWARREVSPTNPLRTVRVCRGGLSYDSTLAVFHVPANISIDDVGDFNGDGYDDLGTYNGNTATFSVYYGSATLDTLPDWQMHCSPIMATGDLNGDGYADLVEQGFAADSIWVFFGSATPDTLPDIALYMASTPLVVNDLNRDEREDLVSGLAVRWGGNSLSSQPDVMLTSPCQFPGGGSETGVGDVNHDGWGDLVLSEEYCDNDFFGAAMLYLGSPWMTSAPAYTFWGFSPPADIIGHQVAAGLGDVNGDGVDDFALGGYNDTNQGLRGRAVVIAGDSNLRVGISDAPPALPQQFAVSVYPNPFNSTATLSLEIPPGERTVDLKLYDVLGREAWHQEVPVLAGKMQLPLNADHLSSGIYFLTATTPAFHQSLKLVVLK